MKADATLMDLQDNVIVLEGTSEGTPDHFVSVFNVDAWDNSSVFHSTENILFHGGSSHFEFLPSFTAETYATEISAVLKVILKRGLRSSIAARLRICLRPCFQEKDCYGECSCTDERKQQQFLDIRDHVPRVERLVGKLAMHASIALHSFGVWLLTQFVRFLVPNKKQLDAD